MPVPKDKQHFFGRKWIFVHRKGLFSALQSLLEICVPAEARFIGNLNIEQPIYTDQMTNVNFQANFTILASILKCHAGIYISTKL